MLSRKQAVRLTQRLDKIANHVQQNYREIGLSRKEARDFCLYVDRTSDQIEKNADVLLHDMAEDPELSTFDGPKVHERMPDDPVMDTFNENTHTQLVSDPDLTPMTDGDLEIEASWLYEDDMGHDASWLYADDMEDDLLDDELLDDELLMEDDYDDYEEDMDLDAAWLHAEDHEDELWEDDMVEDDLDYEASWLYEDDMGHDASWYDTHDSAEDRWF
jgi:hypothetical protein